MALHVGIWKTPGGAKRRTYEMAGAVGILLHSYCKTDYVLLLQCEFRKDTVEPTNPVLPARRLISLPNRWLFLLAI